MTARKVWWSGAWVTLGGSGVLTSQYPANPLPDVVDTATSVRTQVTATAHATPFTDGTYVQIDPALSADASGIMLMVATGTGVNTVNSSTVLEIATGAAAAEAPWATVAVGYASGNNRHYFVPGFIASGTRVAVRARSAVTVQAVAATYSFLAATHAPDPGAPVTMGGPNIATTARGVSLTTPGGANAKGAWVEVVASTSATFGNLFVGIQGGADTTVTAGGHLLDIGIGAASSETVLIGDIYGAFNTNEQYVVHSPLTYGVSIPSGSRLSARYAASTLANAMDVILVGA